MKTNPLFLLATLPFLFPGILSADEEKTEEAGAAIAKLAAANRGAALSLAVKVGEMNMGGLGAFISDDGLALVDLSAIAMKQKPIVLTADGTSLPFGTILGIFPDQELALLKFEHRPKVWLRFAQKEPDVGDTIALVALSQPDLGSVEVPPVEGPVMAKRSGMAANVRLRRFVKILSLGSGLTSQQAVSIGPGCFAVDRQGDLVAIKSGVEMAGSQTLILLAPVVALAEQVGKLRKQGKAIPFPLPEASNPIDLALLDEEFHKMSLAVQRGDGDTAKLLLSALLNRYPTSQRLRGWAAHRTIVLSGEPLVESDDLHMIDPQSPPAEQVARLLERAVFLSHEKGDHEGAIRESKTALALSPKDYPQVRSNLGFFYQQLGRLEESERFYRDAFSSIPESIELADHIALMLFEKGKFDEAKKLTNRVYELERIYQRN